MKFYIFSLFFVSSLFSMEEGPVLYNSCKFCHGIKAEKIYVDIVPAIKNMDKNTLTIKLKKYKKGSIDIYGYGPIMKQQMKNIPDDKISILVNYIKNLEGIK